MGEYQIEHLTEITVHNTSPEQIYDFMLSLTQEKYLKRHPEHQAFKIIKATKNILGSIFYFKETINGFLVDYHWKVIALEKNQAIIMEARKYFVPIYFEIKLVKDGPNSVVKHYLRMGNLLTGRIIKKRFFTPKVMKDLERHAKEEFTNLEQLLV